MHAETLLRAAGGDAKAGHHLIEDQQGAVLVTQLAQRGMEIGIGSDEPDVAEERLDDDGRDLILVFTKQIGDRTRVVEGGGQREARERSRNARTVG